MKQKLAIANAFLPRPAMLILDEPTAGVDVVARGEIWALLQARRTDTLILLSTSYLEEASACDRLVYLDDGRVVASGTPAELRAGIAVELYRAWGAEPRALAHAARQLPWVQAAHATAHFARIEVPRSRSPGADRVAQAVGALAHEPSGPVWLVEQVPVDMEATLLALARRSM
jgi:ABC-type multidrug transport system ATPase subunit